MADKHAFRNVCGLYWQTQGYGPRTGTGFLVGPRHVLTVAHNLFDPELGGDSLGMMARFPGPAPGQEHTIAASDWIPTDQWKYGDANRPGDAYSAYRTLSAFDFGIVILDREPEGGAISHLILGLAEADDNDVALAGYPSGFVQLPHFTFLHSYSATLLAPPHPGFEYRLFYEGGFDNLLLMAGMSGGPVWKVDAAGVPTRGPEGRPQVVGIQTSVQNFNDGLSSGLAITDGVIALVQRWLNL